MRMRFKSQHAGHLLQIKKVRIGILRKPRVIVKGRVIHAIRSAGFNIGRGHTRVLQEGREIRSRAEIANVHFFSRNGGRVRLVAFISARGIAAPRHIHGATERAGHRSRNAPHEFLERRHGGCSEIRSRNCDIDIEVGDRMIQGMALLLHPLRGTDQAFLLGIPTAKDHGPFGAPALAQKRARCRAQLQASRPCRWRDRLRHRPTHRDDCRR